METIDNQFRVESDTLGETRVPKDSYYGAQTVRALENFPISGVTPHPKFTESMVYIKKAAALVNSELGCLSKARSEMIVQAADRILEGEFQDQFVVDVYQAGAGTSFNMNVNEVIANIAIEGSGGKRGDYSIVHPNDHVNCGQSTNDVFPTAMRIAALLVLKELIPVMDEFVDVLNRKAEEFNTVIKSGRTHLQDAAPVRLGQEFSGYADAVSKSAERIENASASLYELGIGGTAVGTGLNTHPEYAERIIRELQKMTKIPVRCAANRFEAMQSNASIAEISGSLKVFVVELIRIANDLRMMSSGPRTGLSEINLPAVQPGSSIMPAKVNPVMAEMLNMVCFSVIGNDLAITMAAQAGQLELNVMMPLMQYKLLDSISIIANALKVFINKCAVGITANRERCYHYAISSFAIVTALNPYIGYSKAAEVAKESSLTGMPIKEIVLKWGLLSEEKLEKVLSLESMTQPGLTNQRCNAESSVG